MSGTHLVAGERIPYEASPATSRWGYLSPATCRWGKARQFARERGDCCSVELPSEWCFNKFRGFGTCVVFKRKKPCEFMGLSIKNFDGASLANGFSYYCRKYFHDKPIKINESYMIWLHYTSDTWEEWKEAKNFVTFCFLENEDIEVKECGARVVCDEDLEQDILNVFDRLSQRGGVMYLSGLRGYMKWSW
ncbi:hypothetical protein Tco_0746945 [Tanacetum coccineum]